MPAITSGKVLLTGANGYISVWVLKDLLENGFSVRGTVRSESKIPFLKELFKSHGDKLEFVIVEDIIAPGAFDQAVQGVDAVLHLASPVNARAVDPDEVIVPAVEGTKSLLNSAIKYKSSIKRVGIMSSAVAMFRPPPPGSGRIAPYIEEDSWNEFSINEVRTKGKDAAGPQKYRAAKALAERAAWDLYESAGGVEALGWDLLALNPPYVYGPILNEQPTLEGFGGTARMWYNFVLKGALQGDALTKTGSEYVDVRDLARAHTLALTVPEAGGKRFIICAGDHVWQQFIDAARKYSDNVPEGVPGYNTEEEQHPERYNPERSKKILGLTYRSLEETTRDFVEDLKARGWL